VKGIVYMIAVDNQPLNMVRDRGFVRLLKILAPQFKIPARSTITNKMNTIAEKIRENNREALAEAKDITLTSDLWTEPCNSKSFMGITIHFLQNNLEFKSMRLGVLRIGAHSAANIALAFDKTLKNWNIDRNQVIAVVTDHAANILAAVREYFGAKKQLGCFAHALNLVVVDSIKQAEVQGTIDKAKEVVTFSRRSTLVLDRLRERQVQNGDKPKKLMQDVQTRWNSEYVMLERFTEIWKDLRPILFDFAKAPAGPNHDDDMPVIADVLILLKPFYEATIDISGETYVTISIVIPLVHCIRQNIKSSKPGTSLGKCLKLKIMDNLLFRFAAIENTPLYSIPTMLDPRFKNKLFDSALAVANTMKLLTKEATTNMNSNASAAADHEDPETSTEEQPLRFNSLWAPHTVVVEKNSQASETSTQSVLSVEMRQYFAEPLMIRKSDPLLYWENNKCKYPNLHKLAVKYLSIIATSVPSERLFSSAGDIITPERNRLDDRNLDDLLFLHSVSEKDFFSV
jgi:zinc finger BED domain-containing protein 1 (E3 SUMO-protein ligase ZBED1)